MVTAFFNISGGEILIILLVVFLFFGPDKIPEIARWMGKGLNEVKKATSEIRDEITRETGDIRREADNLKKSINFNDATATGTSPADKPDDDSEKQEPDLRQKPRPPQL
ncbi:MAG: twin-arginine translocase TatA/TatE family subunit [Bacteroidales bacterium]|jgi:TatA/E family protein of Tat protein translocase|nr:twin-arginine translocase TatA/TatE family subunit [Bacteroidales bacterium]